MLQNLKKIITFLLNYLRFEGIITNNQIMLMRKLYFLLFSFLLLTGYAAQSQCTFTSAFGSATINTSGTITQISSCSFAGEYSTISGAVNGQTLNFTSSIGTDFITIHSGTFNGPVVAFGQTPLSFANTFTGTLYAHWSADAACGTQSACRTTTVQCTSCIPPPPPANDLCTGAISIACGQTIAGTTVGATLDAVGTCVTALGTAPGVWYSMVGDGSNTTLSLCGSGYDTKIGVFSGSCAGLTCVTGNDDFCGLQSQVTFTTTVGTNYYILVTGFGTGSGAFSLARTCVFPCTGVPSPGLISGPSGTLCGSVPVTLNLSGYTTGVTGITFQWKSSATAGGPYTAIPGATNNSYSFTTSATRYYIVTVTCSASGLSSNTTEFAVNVSPLAHINVSATPSTTCSPGTSAITGTAINGNVIGGGSGVIASSGTINLAIPDNSPAGINSNLTIPATTFASAADLKIRINASHTWVGDVIFKLTSPCGVTYLFDRPGVPAGIVGNSDNLGTSNISPNPPPAVYTFDIAGATVIPETNVGTGFIASGVYRPSDINGASQNWAGFTFPCTGGGLWTLNVSDNAGIDVGTLVDWAIIGPVAVSGNYTHTLTGPGTIVQNPSTGPNNQTANFSVSALAAGTHTFTLTSTDLSGCTVSSPVTVTVNPTPVVTITPAAATICSGNIIQLNGGAVPGVTQTFSSGAINLSIPDNTPAGITTAPIVLPAALSIASAGDLKVSINARHSWVGDLRFTLTSPCGTTFLFDRPGVPPLTFGNSSNLGTSNASTPPPAVYVFDLTAATVIPETALPAGFIPTGNYRPSDVNGNAHNWAGFTFPCAATGNWTLNIADNGGGDTGALIDWSIIYTAPSAVVFSPVTNLFTNAAATIPYTGTPVNTVWAKPPTTATYTATATIAGCTSAPASTTITVNQLPAITVHPVAAAAPICSGFNASYSVTATGTGLTYQWQLSTDNGGSWNNISNGPQYSGVTTSNLTVLSVAMAQNGHRFRCVVSGTCPPPATSNSVTLVVATPPTVTTHPPSRTICSGTNTTFTVVAAGVPTPTIYQWQVSTNAGGTWTNLTTGGSYTPSFTITGATTAQSGSWYRVIVTNICGQSVTSNAAVLTVNATPVVTATALPARICISDGPIALSGSPVGGTWSGIGVSGFNFVPGATSFGTYTLTYTYTSSAGCTASTNLVAKVEDCPERIRLLRDDAVIVYPNPNSGNFNLRMNSVLYNYLGMTVYSNSAQQVYTKTFSGLSYGSVVPVNLTHLPSGIYMVKIFYDDGIRTSEKTFPVVIGRQ